MGRRRVPGIRDLPFSNAYARARWARAALPDPLRLLFVGEFGRLEVPVTKLSVSGFGTDRWGSSLSVAVGPTHDLVHEFDLSTNQEQTSSQFLATFERVVREAEMRGSGPGPEASSADELAKFARLRDDGVISAEEFEAKKRQLLA